MYRLDQEIVNFVRDFTYPDVDGGHFSKQNVVIAFKDNILDMSLHGNHIFTFNRSTGEWKYDVCGYPTKTTICRINAVLEGLKLKDRVKRCLIDSRTKTWTTYIVKGK